MSFYGSHFSFDGISCFEHGLMLYDVGNSNEGGKFSSALEIFEDRTAFRHKPLFYGTTQNTPLTFTLIFGADMNSIDSGEHLDRWELEAIAVWLTGHDGYKYLEITQPDMETVRYRCIISNLEYTKYGNLPWAFKCDVRCDSPFAYLYPEKTSFDVNGELEIMFFCRASCEFYHPKVKINITSGNSFFIKNDNRFTIFENLPSAPLEIWLDNENEIITNSADLNIYECFNFNFFRLMRGNNKLKSSGNGSVEFECEFPVNMGG